MKKKQLMILIPVVLILVIGIRAVTRGKKPREQSYSFTVNDYKMVRSTKKSERRNEKAYIRDNLLNNPYEFRQFPLAQYKGRMFMDAAGKHIAPVNLGDIVPRADLIHSRGQVKNFYKLKKSPWRVGSSRVVCLPKSRAREIQSGDYSYKFTTKAEGTKYGTVHYTCYVNTGSNRIKKLFDSLPGKKVRGIKTIRAR